VLRARQQQQQQQQQHNPRDGARVHLEHPVCIVVADRAAAHVVQGVKK